jgi:hypothetical protein
MYKFLLKNGQMMAIAVGSFIVILFIFTAITGLNKAGFTTSTDLVAEARDQIPSITAFNLGLGLTIFLLIATALTAIFFGITKLASNFNNSKKSVITFAGLIVLFILFYSMSGMETTGKLAEIHTKFDIDEGSSKIISGGLKTTLLLGTLAIVAIVVAEVRNIFK